MLLAESAETQSTKVELSYFGELLLKTHTLTFNLHDIVLLFTFTQCLLFSVFFSTQKNNKDGLVVFIAFMLCIGFGALNFFLTYYEKSYNFLYTHVSTQLLCATPLVFYLPGMCLFEFVKTVTYGKFQPHRHQLLPFLLFLQAYTWQPVQRYLGEWEQIFWRDHIFIATVGFSISAFYGAAALRHLYKYADELKQLTADINTVSFNWLKVLTWGFSAIWLLEVLAPFAYNQMHWIQHNLIIHFKNLFQVALVSYVIYSNLLHSNSIQNIPVITFVNNRDSFENQSRNAKHLQEAMADCHYYREHNLTIEKLAENVDMSERELSLLINNYFHKNFYEFINEYRINEAKLLLTSSTHKKTPIQLIYEEVGFHSKSSFNTLFKKYVGSTPTEYRKHFADKHKS